MGISGLYKFIDNNVSNSCKECKLSDFKDKSIAFDAPSFVYKYRFGNRPNTHILEFSRLYSDLITLGIRPVFFFDGDHPVEKDAENERRKNKKRKFLEELSISQTQLKKYKYENGFDPNQSIDNISIHSLPKDKLEVYEDIQKMEDGLDKTYSSQIIVTPQHVEESKQILKSLGAWVIDSPGEAEAYAALMNRLGYIDYVAGDDADFFPFGAKKLIRNIGWRSTRNDKMKLYDIEYIVKKLEINQSQLIDICVLSINDFNKDCRVNGLGCDKSYKGIKEYGSIEGFFEAKIKENEKKSKSKTKLFEIPKRFDYKGIRKIFSSIAFQKEVPQEFKRGNPFKFDMENCLFFFHSRNLNNYIYELKDWAKILEGKTYDDEEIEYLIESGKYEEDSEKCYEETITEETLFSVNEFVDNEMI